MFCVNIGMYNVSLAHSFRFLSEPKLQFLYNKVFEFEFVQPPCAVACINICVKVKNTVHPGMNG